VIFGVIGGTDGLTFEQLQAVAEVNEWTYRKALGLSHGEFLKEPMKKYLFGLHIEDAINRRNAENMKGN
jgi:hypothetical protein